MTPLPPPPHLLTQFPVAAQRDHVAMLASVTHYDSEIPASLNQGLSLLLHEVRVNTTFLLDYQTIQFSPFPSTEMRFPHPSDNSLSVCVHTCSNLTKYHLTTCPLTGTSNFSSEFLILQISSPPITGHFWGRGPVLLSDQDSAAIPTFAPKLAHFSLFQILFRILLSLHSSMNFSFSNFSV